LKASEIDVIFDLVYADRKRQIASMWKGYKDDERH
jgi:hypothetical protein